ncbi:hypothetical protein [Coxiella endosymbiont of Amblyomma nuttalli]|uniref:hypothetical protein n=1 Tax=Coxiella endosymbiont of Amblyomma nuttalli TaxID=2749996 RepID=UPI001BA5D255|nr:hypothetical protein [Coxiella endosymbiont of Amblyomma nuttalli]
MVYTTIGKENKRHQIAVSEAMLDALKRCRKYLNLSPIPSSADHAPLLSRIKGKVYIRAAVLIIFIKLSNIVLISQLGN